ncbi:hypothetical protein [Ktedonobacter sp. SOSP1-85]|uniref:hypothetical protein n=1 Tax=Ktedonobacter sp. SOSP1-85 TaxID=2778367 RepID=UPI001915B90E
MCDELHISRATMYRWLREAAKKGNPKKVNSFGVSGISSLPAHPGDVRRVQKRHEGPEVIESYYTQV